LTSFKNFAAFTLMLAGVVTQPAAYATCLTGLHLFATDAAGNRVLPTAAYTYVPNGGSYVLWVAEGSMDAPFINGPLRDDAAISVVLSPGVHTFFTFSAAGFSEGQSIFPGPITPRVGMNFFLDGNQNTPGISVFAPTNTRAVAPYPLFFPDAGVTANLAGDNSPIGSGALTYNHGGLSVTLTDFLYSSPLVFNRNRISNFQALPDGDREYVGQFTLTVERLAAVPEPSTLVLTAMAFALALRLHGIRATH
jgi:hypothetical protein